MAVALSARLLSGDVIDSLPATDGLDRNSVARILDYMNADLARRITLDDLAREVHLSRYHFLRKFNAATGYTPHRYLTRLRMQRASEMLRLERYDISQIARRCGYASTANFGATFRVHFGTTPSAYRRSVNGEAGHPRRTSRTRHRSPCGDGNRV